MNRSRYADLTPENRKLVDALTAWGDSCGRQRTSMRNPRAFLTAYLWWGADLGDAEAGRDFMASYPNRAVQSQIRHAWDLYRRAFRGLKQPVAPMPRAYTSTAAEIPPAVQQAAVGTMLLTGIPPAGLARTRWTDLRVKDGAYHFVNPLTEPSGSVEVLSAPIQVQQRAVIAALSFWSGGVATGPLVPMRPGSPIGASESLLRSWCREIAPGSFDTPPPAEPLDLGKV